MDVSGHASNKYISVWASLKIKKPASQNGFCTLTSSGGSVVMLLSERSSSVREVRFLKPCIQKT